MVGGAQVLLRVRVLPVALLGRRDGRARDRVPAAGPDPAALSALLGAGRAGLRLEDRRPGPALETETPAVTSEFDVRQGRDSPGGGASARVRRGVQGCAAPARAGDARDVLSPEQGPRERDRR